MSLELARLQSEERIEAPLGRLVLQQAKALSHATIAMPTGPKAQFVTSLTCAADESGSKFQQAALTSPSESALTLMTYPKRHYVYLQLQTIFNAMQLEMAQTHAQVQVHQGLTNWESCCDVVQLLKPELPN